MGKGYKGKNPRGVKGQQDNEAEAEWQTAQRERTGGQRSNVGELPPSGSEDEEEAPIKQKEAPKPRPAGQSATMGMLPPSDSEEDDDDESSDDEPEYFKAAPKKKEEPVERTAEDIRKDLERLELIRKKREDDRKKRIATEGWDRFAPVTETNHPPGREAPPS